MLISHSVWYSRENAGTELSCEGVTSSVVRSLSPLLPPPISTAPAGVLQLLWPFRASLRIANEGYFAVIFTISSLTFFHFHLHLRMCDCWVQAPPAKESQVVKAVVVSPPPQLRRPLWLCWNLTVGIIGTEQGRGLPASETTSSDLRREPALPIPPLTSITEM